MLDVSSCAVYDDSVISQLMRDDCFNDLTDGFCVVSVKERDSNDDTNNETVICHDLRLDVKATDTTLIESLAETLRECVVKRHIAHAFVRRCHAKEDSLVAPT